MKSHSDNERSNETEPSTDYQYAINDFTLRALKLSENMGKKPVIVALYDDDDGAENAEYAIEDFQTKGCEVVRVTPEEGIKHPVFTRKDIAGIFLPGGSDVPIRSKHDERKKLEEGLIDKALRYDIPFLGVCRGLQIFGYHNGFHLGSFDDDKLTKHYGNANKIRKKSFLHGNYAANNDVSVYKGNQLFNALSAKIFGHSNAEKYTYYAACMHHQHLTTSILDNPNVKETIIDDDDGVVEGVQMQIGNYHAIGYQHHPEAITTPARQNRAEKLDDIRQERDNADMFHYQDIEMTLFSAYKAKQKADKVNEQSMEEKIANVELELFTDQVKHKFLDYQLGRKTPEHNVNRLFAQPTLTLHPLAPHNLINRIRKLFQS